MNARAFAVFACALGAFGCADGRSVVTLTVSADSAIAGIDHLHIVATEDAPQRSANPIDIAIAGGTIPPAVTVPLAAPKTIRGGLTLAVTALAADGTTVATGSTDVTIAPSKSFTAAVALTAMSHRALRFTTEPSGAQTNATLGSVAVAIVDDAGTTLTDATEVVSLTLAGGASGAVLSGHVRVAAVAGVATFPDLSVNVAGTGYTIMASAPNADAAASDAFDITPGVWVPVDAGLDGGSMQNLFFDPNDANSAWAIAGASLWHTKDGGASWAQYGSALPSGAIQNLAVSTKTSDTIFLAGGDKPLRRSDDGGASWDVVGAGLPPPIEGAVLTVDPKDDTIVWVVSGGALYRSTDRGDNFAMVTTPTTAGTLVIDPTNGATLYLIVGSGASATIDKSIDSGMTWTAANSGLPAGTPRIYPIDAASGTLWASATTGPAAATICKSTDGGAHWTAVGNPIPCQAVSLVADPSSSMRLFVGCVSVAGDTTTALARSVDGGATWQPLGSAIPLGDAQAGRYRLDAAGNVWAFAAEGPLYKSTDKTSFTFAGHGITAASVSSITFSGLWYIGVFGRGIFRSVAATSWQEADSGFNIADGFYTTVGNTFALDDAYRLYHTTDGLSWSVVAPLIAMDQFYAFDASASNSNDVVAVEGGSIVTSTNAGANWTSRTTTQSLLQPIIRVDPMTPTTFYVAEMGYLSKSTDGGATIVDIQPSASKPTYTAMEIDPTATSTLYVASAASQLFKTTNAGAAWSTVGSGLPANDQVVALAIDRTAPMTVYAVTQAEALYKSTDGAATFKAITAPPGLVSLVVDPVQSGHVVAATFLGVWETTTGGE